MIYRFKIVSPEAKNFLLQLQIDGSETFHTLHEMIRQCVDYKTHQMASFFIRNGNGKKTIEVSMLDAGLNGYPNYSMLRTKISELVSLKNNPVLYTFDLFNDRSFILELTGIDMEKNLQEPLTDLEGQAPVQMLEEDVNVQESTARQEDEVFQDFGVLEDYTEIFGEMDPI
jgi:hypothetical protein